MDSTIPFTGGQHATAAKSGQAGTHADQPKKRDN